MPGKRSKSEERERKRIFRQNRTTEQIALDREKDRNKKKEAWSRKTEEEKDNENNAKRERMEHLRNKTPKEKLNTRATRDEQEENRERIRKLRANQSKEENAIERDKAKERMVAVRARQTIEEKEEENEKAKERMRDLREEQTTEEREEENEKAKERMTDVRARQTSEEREEENEKSRARMEMVRAEKSTEVCAYEKIVQRQEKRNMRKGLSGKEHLEGNLTAKKGMRLLNSVGRLRKFASREAGSKSARKRDEMVEWKRYIQTSEKHREILSKKQPDIVSRINENVRLEKEKERQDIESCKIGEWLYSGESGEYYWTGDTEPEYVDQTYDNPSPPTQEELEIVRQAEEREMAELMKQRKQDIKEKRQKKNEERRAAMEKPVTPLPKRELCQYEKIREEIIRERQEAMVQFQFFENLEKTKKDIGFY